MTAMNEHVINMLYLLGGILACLGFIIGGAVADRRARHTVSRRADGSGPKRSLRRPSRRYFAGRRQSGHGAAGRLE